MLSLAVAVVVLAAWVSLWLGHAGFWRIDREPTPAAPEWWPGVVVVIPARNEAAVIGETLRSLWAQEYPGGLRVVVVDDGSEDGTSEAALRAARELGRESDLELLPAEPLPPGWAGKVWAMHQGVTRGVTPDDPARYVLFSDADISHGQGSLRELVARAESRGAGSDQAALEREDRNSDLREPADMSAPGTELPHAGCDLASYMARLRCESIAERLMIPAFVFFFRLLYPFRRVNDPRDKLAGAAGGTMLVRRDALERIGGMLAIRAAVIDDCALAREVKRGGHAIWLGLSETSHSTRGYGTLGEIVRMIARTAYTQLGYSPVRLGWCMLGLGLTFVAPPALALFGHGWAAVLGAAAWLLMMLLYLPMVRFYRQSPLWAPLLPLTAALYLWATLVSAWNHHRGRGGQWKGRAQSRAARSSETHAS